MPFNSFIQSKGFGASDAIDRASDFTRFFADNAKSESQWAIGAEVELFGFTRDALQRITPTQVQTVIEGFALQIVDRIEENGYVTDATLADAQGEQVGRLTLEPGGQIEFSGAQRQSLATMERELQGFLDRLSSIGETNGLVFIATGFDPVRSLEEQSWIPKRRYEIMKPYLKTRGRRAWDMMTRTAATQANLDYRDLEDLARKFALANRLAPIVAAISANSPFQEGKLSGYKSTRYAAWLETDPDRTGTFPLALDDSFSIPQFIDQLATVPMFFVRRDGGYIDYSGHSFGEFLGRCSCPQTPIFQDFTDHLSTIFTEARLKPHIEQRSMDSGSLQMAMAAMALWKGLLYDAEALDGGLRLMARMTREEFLTLQVEVARHGLEARLNGEAIIKQAEASIELARSGLNRIAPDEAGYLDALEQLVVRERVCPADILIRNFNGSWNGDIRKVIAHTRVGG
ncbi:MAG TPA: glutamate-cysteine ligase family protein [Blastocatellia bacterium]|nr:glutamate-cysteine ligase family protein [Blastocatellia bacterium]